MKWSPGTYSKKGKIQKLPYQLFDYGHLALVFESNGEKKLLQLAMKQAANIDDGLEYLGERRGLWALLKQMFQKDLVDPNMLFLMGHTVRGFNYILSNSCTAVYSMNKLDKV